MFAAAAVAAALLLHGSSSDGPEDAAELAAQPINAHARTAQLKHTIKALKEPELSCHPPLRHSLQLI